MDLLDMDSGKGLVAGEQHLHMLVGESHRRGHRSSGKLENLSGQQRYKGLATMEKTKRREAPARTSTRCWACAVSAVSEVGTPSWKPPRRADPGRVGKLLRLADHHECDLHSMAVCSREARHKFVNGAGRPVVEIVEVGDMFGDGIRPAARNSCTLVSKYR